MDRLPVDFETYRIDDRLQPQLRVDKYPIDFGAARSLQEFPEYRFFTPAILYMFAGISDEPLARYNDVLGRDLQFTFHRFNRPLFAGLEYPDGDADWNHALWCLPLADWDGFENYMRSVMFKHTPRRVLVRPAAQDIQILDPLFLDRHVVLPDRLPVAEITVLGISSNLGQIAMEVSRDLLFPPKVRQYSPGDAMVRYAEQLFSPKPDPTQEE